MQTTFIELQNKYNIVKYFFYYQNQELYSCNTTDPLGAGWGAKGFPLLSLTQNTANNSVQPSYVTKTDAVFRIIKQ
ncbi:hypothetical protein B0A58_10400 [Flavobacterium branchiophilum NBRC 15030 = ATCC 35035]|nr:hypothetical protein B0A58_10400 [Flavobacterium branchiophilum NBRC 15030 = ATCC 35035]